MQVAELPADYIVVLQMKNLTISRLDFNLKKKEQ